MLQGCASDGGETLKIDGKHVKGWQYMPAELTEMLHDLGYDRIPILDPSSHHWVKAVEQDDHHRMSFERVATGQVRIDVLTSWEEGITRLHFYQPGSQTLSASSRELLQKLRKRTALKFGDANVTY